MSGPPPAVPGRFRPRLGLWLGLTCVALAAVLGGIGWAIADWHFEGERKRAARDVAGRRYAPARDRLARLAARRSAHSAVQYQLGLCEAALGHPERADRAWAAVSPTAPEFPRAALARARLLIHHFGRLAAAEPLLVSAADGPSATADAARWRLAVLLVWEGRTEEARRVLEAGWARAPAGERVAYLREHWRLDTVVVAREEVRAVLDAAARHAPADEGCRLVRAALAAGYGRWDEAERHLDACVAARPADPAVWRARLAWAVAVERPSEAARAVDRLEEGALDARAVLRLRAWFAARRGDTDSECALLAAWARLDPGDPVPLERLAVRAQQAGDTARAERLRRTAADVERLKERYRWGILSLPAAPDRSRVEPLARWAEELGRDFEARAWRQMAAPRGAGASAPPNAPRSAPPAAAALAALRSDLARWRTAEPRTPNPAPAAAPTFAEVSLGAVGYQSAPSERRQIPEVMGGGCALLDFDGDGWLDLYLVQGGTFPSAPATCADRLYRNRGDGTFEDVSEPSRLASLPGGFGFGVTAGDYDNDGRPDLFITRWHAYALYRNRGDGTFEDVTERAGLGGDRGFPTSAALADLDNDGDLDLYVCHYLQWDAANPPLCRSSRVAGRAVSCSPRRFSAEPDRLYRNDGGRFVDVTAEAGIADEDGRGLGVAAADLDGDGRVDLYVANDQSPNYLFHNRGGLRFEEVAFATGAACGADGVARAGMGVACGDFDRDGRPDLAVTNFVTESTTFYRNLGAGAFTDATAAVGLAAPSRFVLGFGIAFLDADNDGRLDLAAANGHVHDERPAVPYAMPAQLFLGSDGRLTDVSDRAGPLWSEPLVGRGLATGDLDNDGRLDVLIVPQNHPLVYAHNTTARPGHFVTVRLEGTRSNRDGVGARIVLVAGDRRQTAWRTGGGSYLSSSDPRIHFGLGERPVADSVEVTWPSGRTDRFRDLPADRGYLLREGAPVAQPLPGVPPRSPAARKSIPD